MHSRTPRQPKRAITCQLRTQSLQIISYKILSSITPMSTINNMANMLSLHITSSKVKWRISQFHQRKVSTRKSNNSI